MISRRLKMIKAAAIAEVANNAPRYANTTSSENQRAKQTLKHARPSMEAVELAVVSDDPHEVNIAQDARSFLDQVDNGVHSVISFHNNLGDNHE